MTQIIITSVTGETLPVKVYITDINGNNEFFLGTITVSNEPNPPFTTVNYTTQIPPIYNTAPAIVLVMVDNLGCRVSKFIECTFGCYFNLIFNSIDCTFNFIITPEI